MKWLEHVPRPRRRPEAAGPFADLPITWDVFISYRSSNRHWAMALHDQLEAAGFSTFLDQFVLRPGLLLEDSLDQHLSASASGVLVLSKDVAASDWVKNERRKMQALAKARAGSTLPFEYVIARIDDAPLPFTEQGVLYSDFSNGYEDGPRGPELVRLVYGLVGASVPEAAVRAVFDLDQKTTEALQEIAAASANSQPETIVDLMQSEQPAALDSPIIAAAAAQALISARKPELALDVLRGARQRFARSVRLQQLEALALRRLDRTKDAQKVLAKLYVTGHRDPGNHGHLCRNVDDALPGEWRKS